MIMLGKTHGGRQRHIRHSNESSFTGRPAIEIRLHHSQIYWVDPRR